MASLRLSRGATKPPPGARIDLSHPFAQAEVLSIFALDGQGTFATTGSQAPPDIFHFGQNKKQAPGVTSAGTLIWASNTDGPAIEFTATTATLFLSTTSTLPTTQCTILYIGRKTDSTNRAAAVASVALGAINQDSEYLQFRVPHSDGIIYWDFGYNPNFLAPNRLSVTPPTIGTLVHRYVFTAGPLGSTIWMDGVKLASQSTAITRTNGVKQFRVGDSTQTSTTGDLNQLNFLSVIDAQWSDELCRWWSAEPYAHLASPSVQRTYFLIGGGSSPTATALDWLVQHPQPIARPPTTPPNSRPADQQATFTRVLPYFLGWAPAFPDQPEWAGTLATSKKQHKPPHIPPIPVVLPVPSEGWRPHFPDRIHAKSGLLAALQQAYAGRPLEATGGAAPPLSWLGVAPVRLDRAPAAQNLHAKTEPLSPAFPLVPLAWKPMHPDRLTPAPRTADLRQSVAPVSPVAAVVVPPLSWLPEAPVSVLAHTIRHAQQQWFGLDAFPRPIGLLVPLSWQAKYPDQVQRRLPGESRRPLVVPSPILPIDPTFVETAAPWRPSFPDQLRAVPPAQPLLVLTEPPPIDVIADAVDWILLVGFAITQPDLDGLDITQGAILAVTTTAGGFLDLEVLP